jgi:hypothetical protein
MKNDLLEIYGYKKRNVHKVETIVLTYYLIGIVSYPGYLLGYVMDISRYIQFIFISYLMEYMVDI